MKPYFAKWLPVEEEIEEGDWVICPDNYQTRYVTKLDTTQTRREWWRVFEDDGSMSKKPPSTSCYIRNYKKVEMFLCSRDIKVGDIIPSETFGVTTKATDITENGDYITDELYFHDALHTSYFIAKKGKAFKIIGKISPDAVPYIKDGQEFDEDEIRKTIVENKSNIIDREPMSGSPIYEDIIVYQIKCPWGCFH